MFIGLTTNEFMGSWVTKALLNSGNLSSKKLPRKVVPFQSCFFFARLA